MAVLLVTGLAGCDLLSPDAPTIHASSASPSGVPSDSSTPTTTPTVAPFRIDCDLVLSDSDAAGLSPALKPVPGFAPAAGTLGASMVAQGAQACGWGSATSASLEVVVAVPAGAVQESARATAAANGTPAPKPNIDAAYFSLENGVGRAQLFMGGYWIEVASAAFTTPAQASGVYTSVIDDLRSAGG